MPKITFITADGARNEVAAETGETLLETARHADVEIDGACGGSLACSTCHVLVDDAHFSTLPGPREDETDMLDLAFGRGPTSRLACQVVVTDELDGMAAAVPEPFDI